MNKTVIVYGPQGCGKTLLAQDIAKHFRLSRIVDAENLTPRFVEKNPADTLILTNEKPAWLDPGYELAGSRRVLDFFDVIKEAGLLYDARLLHRDSDGTCLHPHLPAWEDPDDEEKDITPLVNDQGYEIRTIQADEDELNPMADDYWDRMRAWQPEPPDDDPRWRLAFIGDTEDGAAAWFVRPLDLPPTSDQE